MIRGDTSSRQLCEIPAAPQPVSGFFPRIVFMRKYTSMGRVTNVGDKSEFEVVEKAVCALKTLAVARLAQW